MTTTNSIEASKALYAELNRKEPEFSKVEHYLDEGADVNYQTEEKGYTPLMLAVDKNDEFMVNFLLKKGANPCFQNHRQEIASDRALPKTAIYQRLKNHELLVATAENNKEAVQAALAAGAEVNYQGFRGYFALLIAVENNNLELVELLLANGANKHLELPDGYGVFDAFCDVAKAEPLLFQTLDYGKPFTAEQKYKLMNRDQEEDEDEQQREEGRLKTLAARNGQPFAISQLKIYPLRSKFSPAPTDTQIAELELHFGHSIPSFLKEIFIHYNGGRPMLDYYDDSDNCTISYFFRVDENTDSYGNIWYFINNFSKALGPETLPFAEDDFQGIFYLKWVKDNAQVWLYQYGNQPFADEDDLSTDSDEMRFTANCIFNSLEEFLDALYEA